MRWFSDSLWNFILLLIKDSKTGLGTMQGRRDPYVQDNGCHRLLPSWEVPAMLHRGMIHSVSTAFFLCSTWLPHLLLLWSKNQNVSTRDEQREGSEGVVECPAAQGSILPAGQYASIISHLGVHAPISLSTAECQGYVEHNSGSMTMNTRDPGLNIYIYIYAAYLMLVKPSSQPVL